MKTTTNYESLLWQLVEKEKLADLSQFHRPGFFDEVPLYAREADVDFLPQKRANELLLRFALKFLSAVIAYEENQDGYFAAITVWSDTARPIIPNLFAWCRPLHDLREKLNLETVRTPFGRQIARLVARLRPGAGFGVFEDRLTVPEMTRVFIAPTRPPYHGFMPPDTLRRPANDNKRQPLPRHPAHG